MRNVLMVLLGAAMTVTPLFAQDVVSAAAQAQPPAPAQAPPAQPAPPAPPAPTAGARAQRPPTPAPAPVPPVPPGTEPTRLSSAATRNIRFDITISETGGPKPVTKVVSLTVSDNGASGSIRNIARLPNAPVAFQTSPDGSVAVTGPGSFPLNVDVRAVYSVNEATVRASVNVEYQPYVPDAKIQPGVISASSAAVFFDGRRTQILQSTDPLTDRRTTVEVVATVLK